MDTVETVIDRINGAKRIEQVLEIANMKEDYNRLARLLHPDVCKLPAAADAFSRLNQLRDEYATGKKYLDDSGPFTSNGYTVKFTGSPDLLKRSYENYKKLMMFKDATSLNFQKYLPGEGHYVEDHSGTSLTFILRERSVPLSGVTLPQEHGNWILSRMLEFTTWMAEKGQVHCGLNPESVFITPENHGIQVVSFYHMARVNSQLVTVSAKYKNWYPPHIFAEKKAESLIDIEMSKRTAICVLGDRSGAGVKLRKTHNRAVLDFCQKRHEHAYTAFKTYRDLLTAEFPKMFHVLDL